VYKQEKCDLSHIKKAGIVQQFTIKSDEEIAHEPVHP
jgi:hypothetical protein